MPLTLRFHKQKLSVCRLPLSAKVPDSILEKPFSIFLHTKNEKTLVCPTTVAPKKTKREDGWVAFEIVGVFSATAIGILKQVADVLAKAKVSLFAYSTFDTDFILIKSAKYRKAVTALRKAGHVVKD